MKVRTYYIVEKLPVQGRISFHYDAYEYDQYMSEVARAAAHNVLEHYGCRMIDRA